MPSLPAKNTPQPARTLSKKTLLNARRHPGATPPPPSRLNSLDPPQDSLSSPPLLIIPSSLATPKASQRCSSDVVLSPTTTLTPTGLSPSWRRMASNADRPRLSCAVSRHFSEDSTFICILSLLHWIRDNCFQDPKGMNSAANTCLVFGHST